MKKFEIAKFVFEDTLIRHRPPEILLCDQEREFSLNFVKEMCEKMKTVKSFISAYNPQCNGAVEQLIEKLLEVSEIVQLKL